MKPRRFNCKINQEAPLTGVRNSKYFTNVKMIPTKETMLVHVNDLGE